MTYEQTPKSYNRFAIIQPEFEKPFYIIDRDTGRVSRPYGSFSAAKKDYKAFMSVVNHEAVIEKVETRNG